jgi:hypothetical protein
MMVTAPILASIEDTIQTQLESRLQAILENGFRLLRERVAGLVEREGALPVTFWMQERDALAAELEPAVTDGLEIGLRRQRLYIPSKGMFVNLRARLGDTACHLSRDLAQTITVSAAECASDLLNGGGEPGGQIDLLRQQLRLFALSDARAERLAIHQAARAIAAGALLLRRAHPDPSPEPAEPPANSTVSILKPIELCI